MHQNQTLVKMYLPNLSFPRIRFSAFLFAAVAGLTFLAFEAFAQSDVSIGQYYRFNLQRQTDNADAYIFHNAKVDAAASAVFRWETTHPTFGSRGIIFSYYNGIEFFADAIPTTAGSSFTPTPRFVIRNDGNVGIGTSLPSEKLSIQGTGSVGAEIVTDGTATSRPVLGFFRGAGFWHIGMNMDNDNTDNFHFRYNGSTYPFTIKASSGYVGIGTRDPRARLHIVDGDLLLQNETSGYPILWLKDVPGVTTLRVDYNSILGAGSKLIIRSDETHPIVLNDVGGNVGIGTTTPNEKLTVNGTIYGKEVKVDLSVPGPDYVFRKDYDLPSLEDVKAHIQNFNRLPEVPSAQEMAANGIQLAEMNMLLLKKIEELTLYVIELERENQRQDSLIQYLQINSK